MDATRYLPWCTILNTCDETVIIAILLVIKLKLWLRE